MYKKTEGCSEMGHPSFIMEKMENMDMEENTSELLQYMLENDIVDLACIRKMKDMADREKYLKKHPYKIWQGKDEKWRTYLPDASKKNGRKLVKRKSEEDIKKEIIAYYRTETENPTIEEIFEEWNDRRLSLGKISESTHERNIYTYKRHYTKMGKRRIKQIEAEEFSEFLEEQIAEHDLTAKAFSNLKSITRGFLKRARKRKLLNWLPEDMFQELDVSDRIFKKVIKEDEEIVFNEDEFPKYVRYLEEHMDLKNLGIMLMFVTGIREGELVTLKHSDIEGNTIKIRRTETRVFVGKGHYEYRVKEFPKSQAGVRTVIVQKGYSWVIQKLRLSNPFEEYIFTSDKGKRMTTNVIRRRMERTCRDAKVIPKSPHKARMTYASILLDNNMDRRMVIGLMGHTDIECTEGHYHKNRRSIERKAEILSNIPDFQDKY